MIWIYVLRNQNAINLDYCPYVMFYRATGNLQSLIILIIIILHITFRPYLLKDYFCQRDITCAQLTYSSIPTVTLSWVCRYYRTYGISANITAYFLGFHNCFFFFRRRYY